MPLFTFKCSKCDTKKEKFFHILSEDLEILCEECGSKCEREFSMCGSEVMLDAKDEYRQRILPDIKRISDNIASGKDSDFIDICGDD